MSTDDLWKMWQGSWSVYQLVNTVTKLGFNIKYHQCHSIISKMAPHANNGTCPWSLLYKRKTKISDPIHLLFKAKNMHRQSNKMPVFIECLHQIVFVKWRIKHKNKMTFLFSHINTAMRKIFICCINGKCTQKALDSTVK